MKKFLVMGPNTFMNFKVFFMKCEMLIVITVVSKYSRLRFTWVYWIHSDLHGVC